MLLHSGLTTVTICCSILVSKPVRIAANYSVHDAVRIDGDPDWECSASGGAWAEGHHKSRQPCAGCQACSHSQLCQAC
jgi:hypothetical protein